MKTVFFCYPLNFYDRKFLSECERNIAKKFGSDVIRCETCDNRDELLEAVYKSWAVCTLLPYPAMKIDDIINFSLLLAHQMEKGMYVIVRDFSVFRLNEIYGMLVETLTQPTE